MQVMLGKYRFDLLFKQDFVQEGLVFKLYWSVGQAILSSPVVP